RPGREVRPGPLPPRICTPHRCYGRVSVDKVVVGPARHLSSKSCSPPIYSVNENNCYSQTCKQKSTCRCRSGAGRILTSRLDEGAVRPKISACAQPRSG